MYSVKTGPSFMMNHALRSVISPPHIHVLCGVTSPPHVHDNMSCCSICNVNMHSLHAEERTTLSGLDQITKIIGCRMYTRRSGIWQDMYVAHGSSLPSTSILTTCGKTWQCGCVCVGPIVYSIRMFVQDSQTKLHYAQSR